ncbi:unnamed protein product [Arctia plantaginis]|uniref:Uncharacterized protein n=1 Tax=Arctia plantaginis TaxID=874455 RepID=A0A8S1AWZ0_ARCPL|nr:unnamed protein product [Arctia plantaginis]
MSLYEQQVEKRQEIARIKTNFNKDSASRKTVDYYKTRLGNLDSLWEEFKHNHDRMCTEESRTHQYFTEKWFESTEECYREVRALLWQSYQQMVAPLVAAYEEKSKLSSSSEQDAVKQQELDSKISSAPMFIPKIDNINHIIRIPVPEEEINETDSGELSSTIDQLKQQIKDLKASSSYLDYDLSPHDIQQYAGISILFVVFLLVGGAFLWKKQQCTRRGRRVITPDIELQSTRSSGRRNTNTRTNRACSPINFKRSDCPI